MSHFIPLGAVCGDIAGSIYEFHNIKYKLQPDHLIQASCHFTDDTVMTCAVADGLHRGLLAQTGDWPADPAAQARLEAEVVRSMQTFGRRFPQAGYGGKFRRWLETDQPQPYYSWGNGSAMRVSYAGWYAGTMEEAGLLARCSAEVTHNHPEGIKGAQVVAGCIYLLRSGGTKEDVRRYAGQFYDLEFTLNGIRPGYSFDVSCQGSVPQAIVAFLEGTDFADTIANAISIGGDSDTIAAIAGSIAEVIFPIPEDLRARAMDKLDPFLRSALESAAAFIRERRP